MSIAQLIGQTAQAYNTLMSSSNLITVSRLTKVFPGKKSLFSIGRRKKAVTAVNNISFSVKKGEILGLLGPNGAGKTTTIHMLLGLITPTSGTIRIFGKNFADKRKEILQKMNFSSSYTHLPWNLTVWENLYVAALLYDIKNPKEKVRQIIKLLHLEAKANTEVNELSSGWNTRLNLGRTFINDPQFILLDEPTSSLDPEGAEEIRKQILKIRKELATTILWTSHNMAEVEEVCDRVIFLNKGKIIAEDTPEGLAKRIEKIRISLMVKDGKKRLLNFSRENKRKAVVRRRFLIIELLEDDIPRLINFIAGQKIEYTEISIEKPKLEDYFLAITRKANN